MTFQVKNREEGKARYGELVLTDIDRLIWPNERNWCEMLVIPPFASTRILNAASGKPWDKVYCNKDMAKALIDTLELLHIRNLLREIKTFDGCYMPRFVRGRAGVYSWHSYALALDFNSKENPLGQPSKWSEEFLNTWVENGFIVGARFNHRKDAMHFQFAGDDDLIA